jgi:single-strand DNA-binding protein
MNKVILIGNLTRDPELKTYTSQNGEGCYVAETLAVTTKNANGESIATFIDFKVWGKRAETLTKFTKKGSKLALEGAIAINTYTDKDGNNRKATYVNVDNFEFLSANSSGNSKKKVSEETEPQFEISDEDLPF